MCLYFKKKQMYFINVQYLLVIMAVSLNVPYVLKIIILRQIRLLLNTHSHLGPIGNLNWVPFLPLTVIKGASLFMLSTHIVC